VSGEVGAWVDSGFRRCTDQRVPYILLLPALGSLGSVEIKEIAVNGLRNAYKIFRQDLEALSEDAFNRSLGGKARTVADIVHEVNLVNDHITLTIKGEELFPWPEGWITAPAGQTTKEATLAAFDASSKKTLETVECFSAEELEEKVSTEHGQTTRFERCRFMMLHLWYHSGQLNFIQTLLGDDEWHWN
jgi:uncharacterized damage-inducible protein DinB